jgi:hypothetical protein
MAKSKKYHVEEYLFVNRRPFVQGVANLVENQKELLSLPWVRGIARKYGCTRFTISNEEEFPDTKLLVGENEDCTFWWCIAILPKDFPIDLPTFTKELQNNEASK